MDLIQPGCDFDPHCKCTEWPFPETSSSSSRNITTTPPQSASYLYNTPKKSTSSIQQKPSNYSDAAKGNFLFQNSSYAFSSPISSVDSHTHHLTVSTGNRSTGCQDEDSEQVDKYLQSVSGCCAEIRDIGESEGGDYPASQLANYEHSDFVHTTYVSSVSGKSFTNRSPCKVKSAVFRNRTGRLKEQMKTEEKGDSTEESLSTELQLKLSCSPGPSRRLEASPSPVKGKGRSSVFGRKASARCSAGAQNSLSSPSRYLYASNTGNTRLSLNYSPQSVQVATFHRKRHSSLGSLVCLEHQVISKRLYAVAEKSLKERGICFEDMMDGKGSKSSSQLGSRRRLSGSLAGSFDSGDDVAGGFLSSLSAFSVVEDSVCPTGTDRKRRTSGCINEKRPSLRQSVSSSSDEEKQFLEKLCQERNRNVFAYFSRMAWDASKLLVRVSTREMTGLKPLREIGSGTYAKVFEACSVCARKRQRSEDSFYSENNGSCLDKKAFASAGQDMGHKYVPGQSRGFTVCDNAGVHESTVAVKIFNLDWEAESALSPCQSRSKGGLVGDEDSFDDDSISSDVILEEALREILFLSNCAHEVKICIGQIYL